MTSITAAASLPYPLKGVSPQERYAVAQPERIVSGLQSSEAPPISDDLKQRLLHASTFNALATIPPEPMEAADNTVAKIWGNIEVGGAVVAQLYQSGTVVAKAGYELPRDSWDSSDPAIRAKSMIQAYGGTLVLRDRIEDLELFTG